MNQIEAMKQALEELSWHRFSRAEGILRIAIEQALTPGEPVAWMHTGGHVHVRNPQWPPKTAALYTAEKGWTPLYTAPQPQREWVGLSLDDYRDLCAGRITAHDLTLIRAVEESLKGKNS